MPLQTIDSRLSQSRQNIISSMTKALEQMRELEDVEHIGHGFGFDAHGGVLCLELREFGVVVGAVGNDVAHAVAFLVVLEFLFGVGEVGGQSRQNIISSMTKALEQMREQEKEYYAGYTAVMNKRRPRVSVRRR